MSDNNIIIEYESISNTLGYGKLKVIDKIEW